MRAVLATGPVLRGPTGAVGATAYVIASDAPSAMILAARRMKGAMGDLVQICDGTGDETEINAAISALPSATGGTVLLSTGTFNLSSTVNLSEKLVLTGSGGTKLVAGMTSAPLFQGVNLGGQPSRTISVVLRDMYLDGAWKTGVAGIVLDGVSFGLFQNLQCDKFLEPVVDLAITSGTRETTDNLFQHVFVFNARKLLRLYGTSSYPVTYNRFEKLAAWGTSDAVATLIDFAQYCYGNLFCDVLLSLNYAGSIGVVYNSASPATDVRVYQNHFDRLVINQNAASTTSIDGNLTTAGRPSYVSLRTGGSYQTYPDLQADSDVRLYQSNINTKPTENSGRASVTGAVSYVDVTHGLTTTPARVYVTPLQGGQGDVWVSTRDSSTFRIAFATQPGSDTWLFDWRAQVSEG